MSRSLSHTKRPMPVYIVSDDDVRAFFAQPLLRPLIDDPETPPAPLPPICSPLHNLADEPTAYSCKTARKVAATALALLTSFVIWCLMENR